MSFHFEIEKMIRYDQIIFFVDMLPNAVYSKNHLRFIMPPVFWPLRSATVNAVVLYTEEKHK